MFEQVWNFIIGFQFRSPEAFWLYWVPVVFCLFGYILDFFKDYRRDVEASTARSYTAHLTWGSILGRVCVAFFPVINIGVSVVWHFARIAKNLVELFNEWLNVPLVPHNYVEPEQPAKESKGGFGDPWQGEGGTVGRKR